MKNLLVLFALLVLGANSFGQEPNPLYMGYRSTGSLDGTINIFDTTGVTGGAAPTLIGSISLSSDAGFTIQGTHGLALNPLSQEMYILYQTTAGGSSGRRLGVLDTVSGLVTDIGNVGNMTDIAFRDDGTMYITSGDNVGRALYEVDPSDATTTLLSTYALGPTFGNGFGYDPYADRLIYVSQSPAYFAEIELTGYTETNMGFGSHPGWCNNIVMLNEDQGLVIGGNSFFLTNFTTLTWTNIGSHPSGNYGHAACFGSNGISVIVDGPDVFCLNEPSTLAASDTASTYQWLLDDAPIAGATDSTYIPDASGDYSWIQNGIDTSSAVTITVLPIPDASFDATPNPVDLAVTTSGAVDFTNTTTGADEYHWDFDNGIQTTLTDPTASFNDVGDYDVTLVATDTTTGCMDTAVVTVTVINSVGIEELQAQFKVYPVPTEDIFYVDMTGADSQYIIELRDLNGRLISQQELQTGNTTVTYDLTDFESGVYLVRVFNDKEEGHFKVLKK